MSAGDTVTKRRAKALAVVLVALCASSLPATRAVADHDGAAAEQAAREILDARDRANAAAQAVFDAESDLDELSVALDRAERDLADLEAAVAALRDGLAESAVRQFVGATGPAIPLFSDVASSNRQAAAQVYTAAATESELVRADDYDAAVDRLENARADIERRTAETERARETHAHLMAAAQAEVARLEEVEAARIHDVEVQHALERQRVARLEQERVAAAAAVNAEANRIAAPTAGESGSSTGSSGSSSSGSGSSGSSSGSSGSSGGSSGSSGSSSSGSGSSGGSPAPAPSAGLGIICPVAGPHGFADTWGAPRSGGRTHKGVDMIAAEGVPIVAVEAGRIEYGTQSNGALVARHWGASGDYYFYGHFSAFEGSARYVSQGEVIGYNGATGTGVPHLHFEVHPGGGVAVNPYPYVRAVC